MAGGMPPLLDRLRLAVARLFQGSSRAPNVEAGFHTVQVTVGALTSDGADMRILMDVRVEGGTLEARDRDRFVHAVTIPAVRHWIERHDLSGLQAQLTPVLDEVGRRIQEPLAEMGLTLLDVQLFSAEHLLSRPSTDPADGPE